MLQAITQDWVKLMQGFLSKDTGTNFLYTYQPTTTAKQYTKVGHNDTKGLGKNKQVCK